MKAAKGENEKGVGQGRSFRKGESDTSAETPERRESIHNKGWLYDGGKRKKRHIKVGKRGNSGGVLLGYRFRRIGPMERKQGSAKFRKDWGEERQLDVVGSGRRFKMGEGGG